MSYVRNVALNGHGRGQDPNAGLLAGRRGGYVSGLFDDLFNTGTDVAKNVSNDLQTGGGDIAQQLINSSQFKVVLDKVEEKAREGVKAEASKNALALFGLAVSAGTVGGVILGKLPKNTGLIGASAILVLSVGWLFKNAADTAGKK